MSAGAKQSAHSLSGHYMQHGLVAPAQRLVHNIFLERMREEGGRGGKTSSDDGAPLTLRPPSGRENRKKADGGRDEKKEKRQQEYFTVNAAFMQRTLWQGREGGRAQMDGGGGDRSGEV